jgi:hypothetical protein
LAELKWRPFALLGYDETRHLYPKVDTWMPLAQNAALGADTLILEDGPELPKVRGSHAEEGGEASECIYAEGCSSLRDARRAGTAKALDSRWCR